MSRWRVIVVACLLVLPFLGLAAVGSYYLWTLQYGWYTWLVMFVLMTTGYTLAWRWQRARVLLLPPDFESPPHWTARDSQALTLVQARAEAASKLERARLLDSAFYFNTAREMAQEIAAFYHPGAKDPVTSLTVPELLAVIELAAHDLGVMVERYLPAGHLMSIDDWRKAKVAADWAQKANLLYWLVYAIYNPVDAGMRFAASKVGVSGPLQQLQDNLVLWFYVSFVERVGHYLIEVNSGRLRVGVKRYLELLGQRLPAHAPEGVVPEASEQVKEVTVTLLGQVKAGKSSLVNALLGEQRAKTDVLPATEGVDRYELQSAGIDTRLVLLDTVGYAHTGPQADQVKTTRETAQKSDLLLLVLHARNPARQADVDLLRGLQAWYSSKPELKCPPILAVVTHIDLLSPALEWQPPYNWKEPKRPKEENIHQALAAVRAQLGDFISGIVPVCTAAGKVVGVEEDLLPAIAGLMEEAHGVALLRVLKAETDTGKVRRVFQQLLATGKEAAKIVWQQVKA